MYGPRGKGKDASSKKNNKKPCWLEKMKQKLGHKNWKAFIKYISDLPEDPEKLLEVQSALFGENLPTKSHLSTSAFEFSDIVGRLSIQANDEKLLALGLYKLYVLLKRIKCNMIKDFVSALQEIYENGGKESLRAFFHGFTLLLKLTYNIAK